RGKGRFIVPIAAVLAGAGVLFVVSIIFLNRGAVYGARRDPLLTLLVVLVGALVLVQLFLFTNAWTPPPVYQQTLWEGVAVYRATAGPAAPGQEPRIEAYVVKPNSDDQLSDLDDLWNGDSPSATGLHMPKLVVCCALNIAGDELPPGRGAVSLTFESD